MSTRTITKRHLFAAWVLTTLGASLYRLWNPFGMTTWAHVAEHSWYALPFLSAVWLIADKEGE